MPKYRKRKTPIVQVSNTSVPSTNAQGCRKIIRQFHILLKRRVQFQNAQTPNHTHSQELADIDDQITRLGGLEKYQQISVLGQKEDRGGGSEKLFIGWMKKLNIHQRQSAHDKLRLLEVGALKPDNYKSCISWIDCTPIDLHSRHPHIMKQDFLTMDIRVHENRWDAISLSLVVNFVPLPADRGRMLRMAHKFLVADGLLFLSLPLSCVANSRYLTFEHLKILVESLGFTQIHERWRQNGKMAYWLYQKSSEFNPVQSSTFNKKVVLRQGNRNNFAIVLL